MRIVVYAEEEISGNDLGKLREKSSITYISEYKNCNRAVEVT